MEQKGHCKHGEFNLREGCPDCIQEAREAAALGEEVPAAVQPIVKVQYLSNSGVPVSDREYSYFSIDPLKVGDVVHVPVRDRVQKAVVTAIDVPESEIESFRDQVKTIQSGYIIRDTQALPEETAAEEGGKLQARLSLSENVSEETKEAAAVLEEITGGQIQVVQTEPDQEGTAAEKPPALAVIETQVGKPTNDLFVLYQEAASLHRVAKARTITTNEDLKPATDDLAIIATCKKAMFARKTEIVEPFKARLDAINQAFADLMFSILEADRLTRGQVNDFGNEQRRKAAEAQRIEDEKLRLAREEETLTGEHTVELGTAQAPPPVPERTRTDLGTLGGRANWKARVVDFALLPDEYKLPNESKLNAHARTTKGERPIPGVEFYDDHVVTMRTRGA